MTTERESAEVAAAKIREVLDLVASYYHPEDHDDPDNCDPCARRAALDSLTTRLSELQRGEGRADSLQRLQAVTQGKLEATRDRLSRLEEALERANSAVTLAINLMVGAEEHDDYTKAVQALEVAAVALDSETKEAEVHVSTEPIDADTAEMVRRATSYSGEEHAVYLPDTDSETKTREHLHNFGEHGTCVCGETPARTPPKETERDAGD